MLEGDFERDPRPLAEAQQQIAAADEARRTLYTQQTLTAERLAYLLANEVFDALDAARYLGIQRNSLEYAAHRGRIRYVQYGSKKLFVRADLDNYKAAARRGRGSNLTTQQPLVARAGKR